MPLYVAPRAPYTSRLALGRANTGLAGTVRFRLIDNDGDVNDPIYGPSTANIVEDPGGSGSYVFTAGVAPVTSRLYSRVWDTGPSTELIFDEDMFVTSTIAAPGQPSGYDLCTLDDVKRYVPSYVSNTATDTTLQELITAASALIPRLTGREIIPISTDLEARKFTVDSVAAKRRIVPIGDLTTVDDDTVVNIYNEDGTEDVAGLDGSLYVPMWRDNRTQKLSWEPVTALAFPSLDGGPKIRLGKVVEVTGRWGFPEIPAYVREATAARVVLRYLSSVDAHGTGFAAAVQDSGLNLGGLFQSSEEALEVLGA